MHRIMIIAVDGPAASGKGTIARALAKHYGLPHLDTGLLYRAVAATILREELDEGNRARNKSAERIQTLIMEEIASLKNGLLNETQSREEADESIVTALNEYTKTLQDSLRVVNTLPQ